MKIKILVWYKQRLNCFFLHSKLSCFIKYFKLFKFFACLLDKIVARNSRPGYEKCVRPSNLKKEHPCLDKKVDLKNKRSLLQTAGALH